ncbi:hypothetical protein EI94DRAFT_681860 [Lactarius quietus]|nr:hypothetical protein EI94DRAFT_681860 [Lactarius quietus]
MCVNSSMSSEATHTATLIPSPPNRDVPHSAVTVGAPGSLSRADSDLPWDTFQPISKPQIAESPSEQALNSIRSPDSVTSNLHKKSSLVGLAADRVLTGVISSSRQPQKPLSLQPASASPHSPRRQSRIPSTGSRALVMDVAQALQQAEVPPEGEVPIEGSISPQPVDHHAPPREKCKSNYIKHTAFMMPPLVEERALPARGVSPETEVEFGKTLVDLESETDATLPGQKDDIFFKIRDPR